MEDGDEPGEPGERKETIKRSFLSSSFPSESHTQQFPPHVPATRPPSFPSTTRGNEKENEKGKNYYKQEPGTSVATPDSRYKSLPFLFRVCYSVHSPGLCVHSAP